MKQDATRSVLITGAGSYLGQQTIHDLLSATDWAVVAVGSPRLELAHCVPAGERLRYLSEDLSEPSAGLKSALAAVDVVIHLAWVRHPLANTAIEINTAIVDELLDGRSAQAKLIFMSSVAASPNAHSSYGQAKFALAEHVARAGGIVLTCGLVCAEQPQGPYKQLVGAVDRLPVRVLPVGRPPNVYPVALTDVLAGLRSVAGSEAASGIYRLWADVIPMHRFLAELPVRARSFRLPVPVPFFLINPVVSLFRTIRLLSAATADQLKTFLFKDDAYLARLSRLPDVDFAARRSRG
ncbi:MAG: NAD-dependent epimerase/dehydratase family protein [Pseudomonadota bacterium]